jgi:FkbM family methyltransferase
MADVDKSFWIELIGSDKYKLKIIDIGAADMNDGVPPSYQKLIELGIAKIIGFEPNKEACKDLNNKKEIESLYLPYFIGNGETATFYETNWAPTSSLYRPNTKLLEKFHNLNEITRVIKEHQVSTHRLDDITEISSVDFIKMDVQGSELNVLTNGVNILNTAVLAQVEVEFIEMYKGQPLFSDVDSFMRSRGFQFHCFDGGSSEQLSGRPFKPLMINNNPNIPFNQTLWADAYYVRDWMKLSLLSREQLTSYAILTYLVLGSYDLTHLILSHIDKQYKSIFADRFLKILLKSNQ